MLCKTVATAAELSGGEDRVIVSTEEHNTINTEAVIRNPATHRGKVDSDYIARNSYELQWVKEERGTKMLVYRNKEKRILQDFTKYLSSLCTLSTVMLHSIAL